MLTVTATELPRLISCNGSRLMGDGVAPSDTDTTDRDKGIAAHWFVQQRHAGNQVVACGSKAPNGIYITVEMIGYLEEYIADTREAEIEVDTSFGAKNWHINGRSDAIHYNPGTQHLNICELKYGWHIVEPKNDWTLIAHAIGWMLKNPDKPIQTITFTIYQPRPHHHISRVRTWNIDIQKLGELHAVIKGTLTLPNDELNSGPIQCYRCPHVTNCPAARQAEYNSIEASEMAFVDEIDNVELSFRLDQVSRALSVLKEQEKAYNDLALHRIKKGDIVKNYSLINDMTNLLWKDHVTPEIVQMITGEDLTTKKLITPTQAKNKGVSEGVIASMAERRNKGAKLVRMDADDKAKKMFNT